MTDVLPKDEAPKSVLSNSILPPSQIDMRIVACPEAIDANDLTTFNPLFTYHLFSEKESDETYENAKIDIVYSALDFSAWLRIRSDTKVSSDTILHSQI
uniref:AlNc14C41G3500 protein n=1 Tax=Albugo laibachii Nc14 TaxID=890382 RepID=F0W9P5_9STRA|nr:AlNc14C41G3500 [Albugo laibachii Nc14]|eukprot:CCA17863.1 AlNc14C41G3500 [Albugo laibachii Nc14]